MPVHRTKDGGYQWGSTGKVYDNYLSEEWRDIQGYEGFYQISSFGHVRHLVAWRGNHFKSDYISHISKTTPYIDSCGYLRVALSAHGVTKHYRVHRLVAQAFIPNPNNLPQINHKDENKQNNHISNLEWCTQTYNNQYGTRGSRIGATNSRGKGAKRAVLQYDMLGNFIRRWKSMQEASDTLLTVSVPKICACCRGIRKSTGGFVWKYECPNERNKESVICQ